MDASRAVSLALSFVAGLRQSGLPTPATEARAFIEHLSGNGFVVRAREGAEWRRAQASTWDARGVSPGTIRAMREARGLSLAALAARAGISSRALRKMETARTVPHARTLQAVMDALARSTAGIDVEDERSTA